MKHALFVHAHPDDETINNGATMAQLVEDGVAVTWLLVLVVKRVRY